MDWKSERLSLIDKKYEEGLTEDEEERLEELEEKMDKELDQFREENEKLKEVEELVKELNSEARWLVEKVKRGEIPESSEELDKAVEEAIERAGVNDKSSAKEFADAYIEGFLED
jgi:hypothetical protein